MSTDTKDELSNGFRTAQSDIIIVTAFMPSKTGGAGGIMNVEQTRHSCSHSSNSWRDNNTEIFWLLHQDTHNPILNQSCAYLKSNKGLSPTQYHHACTLELG